MAYHIFGTTFNYCYHIFGTTFLAVHHIFGTTFQKCGLIVEGNLFTLLLFYSFSFFLFHLFTLKISKNPTPLACFR